MRKIVFAIADYKDNRQNIFENYLSPRNKKYCDYHDYEYKEIKSGIKHRGNYTWQKIFEIKDMLDKKELRAGDSICNIDADMCIVNGSYSIFPKEDKSFSLAIDNGNTHCWGWISFNINDWSINMINQIVDEDRWNRLKDTPHAISFREQAMWYYLAGIMPHSWISFLQLKNYGWYSNFNMDETYYSLDELYDNVEIRGPEWNTTLLSEEQNDEISRSLQKYNIVKSKKEDTIIRHWAGGQNWNYQEYCSKEIIFK
jgi:hypothetical protein